MRQGEEASSLSPGGAFPATTSTIVISPPKMAFTRWREGEPPKLKQFLHFVPGQAWSVGASTKFDRDIKVCYNRAKSYNSHLGSVASRRGAAGKSPQPPFSKGKKGVRQDIIERGTTLAVIVGNRDFFPDVLVTEGRKEILSVLDEMPAV